VGAQFGYHVAGAGDVNGDRYGDVVVGARYYDAGQTDEGAAFVFLGSASGIPDGTPAAAATRLESNQADAQLGVSLAGAGDVNGDGYADRDRERQLLRRGPDRRGCRIRIPGQRVGGSRMATPPPAGAQLESNQDFALLGSSVGSAGDVNGDGYGDVIAGAYQYDAGQTNEGAAFVFLGSASGLANGNPATAAAQLESDQATAEFGHSVGSGDVNGDGYSDVIVGAYQYDAGQSNEGAAFVFLGSVSGVADGNPATAAAQLESDQPEARLGQERGRARRREWRRLC
jgi:hypothetical protein